MFKILIAEDDRELRQLFAHVLTKNGYTVLGVSNGEEALAALEQSYYDLIISDIMMPKMDGYELVRSIRESGSSIPIMMITAKDAFDDMRLGFLSGSDDYMVKPINIGEMVLRVSALLRRAQMAQSMSVSAFVSIATVKSAGSSGVPSADLGQRCKRSFSVLPQVSFTSSDMGGVLLYIDDESFVVFGSGLDLVGAVDLLEQHHARQVVRKCHRRHREPQVGFFL